jgi:hypothetical protein
MRPQSRSASRSGHPGTNEELFERKSRELVAPDDEIEAWELDAQDLGDIGLHNGSPNTTGLE